MNKLCLSIPALVAFLATVTPARAQITLSGNVSAGGSVTFSIVSDLIFTITTTASLRNLIMDEWVTTDGSATSMSFPGGSTLSYEKNGVPGTVALTSLRDNFNTTSGSWTPNDGPLLWANSPAISVVPGDTITLKAGSWNLTGVANFNPQTVQTFTGNVFLSNGGGGILSNVISAVPEPGEYGLMAGAGLLGWAICRRQARALRLG